MERLVKQIGTPSDAPGLRRRLTGLRASVKDQVTSTGHTLKRMEESTRGPGHREERLRLERLKSEYSDVVKRYRNVLRTVMEAERSPAGSLSFQVHPSGLSTLHEPSEDDSQGLLEAHKQHEEAMQQLQRQEDDIEFNQALIEEREDNIRAIEAEIVEINEMFRDLGTLVHEQGEQIDLIEANITKTKTTVEEGKEQLQSASKYQKKARTKMCICLVIILIIAIVVAIIIVVEVKK
jgi:DNA repair exonuclease SbcCD ATPase subunit